MTKKILTLSLIVKDGKILLGMKKRGFGMGKWNGFGGKLDAGESIEDATKRETLEECGIAINTMEKVGVNTFTFEGDPISLEVHIYKTEDFSGEVIETEEMQPQWFAPEDIPYDLMWDDDRYWWPLFLTDKKFIGTFFFDSTGTKVLRHELKEVTSLVA